MYGFAIEFTACVWMEAVFEKKKSRIKKYPDTCGQGLSAREDNEVLFVP